MQTLACPPTQSLAESARSHHSPGLATHGHGVLLGLLANDHHGLGQAGVGGDDAHADLGTAGLPREEELPGLPVGHGNLGD